MVKCSKPVFLTAVLSAIISLICLSSCHYRNLNGDLDGQWQLMSIEHLDGSVEYPEQIYYAIYMHTINLRGVGKSKIAGNMNYNKKNGVLLLEFPLKANLKAWGLPDSPCDVTFQIKKLNKGSLIMELDTDKSIFHFRKF